MKIKTLNMIRKIRENHYNILKNKSKEDIIKFFHEKSKQLEIKNKGKVRSGNLT
jgi:hypothetical protein